MEDTDYANGYNPLMSAAAEGELEIAKKLWEVGYDVNETTVNGYTALMFAAINNQIEVIRFLLSVGADKTAVTRDRRTAVCFAIENKNYQAAVLIVKSNIRILKH